MTLSIRAVMRIAMAAFFAAGFVLHLQATDALAMIVPAFVPHPRAVVLATGWIELAFAAMLLIPRLRRLTGVIIALYVLAYGRRISATLSNTSSCRRSRTAGGIMRRGSHFSRSSHGGRCFRHASSTGRLREATLNRQQPSLQEVNGP